VLFFCQNDNIALAVYDICNERGLSVGDDISIVGFDNNTYSQYIRPALTTVNFPLKEMGVSAANSLLSLVNNESYLLENKLSPELVIRDSVKNLRKSAIARSA